MQRAPSLHPETPLLTSQIASRVSGETLLPACSVHTLASGTTSGPSDGERVAAEEPGLARTLQKGTRSQKRAQRCCGAESKGVLQ